MPRIQLQTLIDAPIERVFDLARSIDVHMATTSPTKEIAIGGRTSGLVEEGDSVRWEATHLGVRQQLEARISKLDRPTYFEDIMVSGAFESMSHQHHFKEVGNATEMTDILEFRAPLGIFGRIAESLFLTRYMEKFIHERNQGVKRIAEWGAWMKYLPNHGGKLEFTPLERSICQWIASHCSIPALKEQLENAEIRYREYTGKGYFTGLSVPSAMPRCGFNVSPVDPLIRSADLEYGGGSVLFLEDGYLSLLECFAFGETFPMELDNFQLLAHGEG